MSNKILAALVALAGWRNPPHSRATEDEYDTASTRIFLPSPTKEREFSPDYGPQVSPVKVVKRKELPKQPKTTRRERKQRLAEGCLSIHKPTKPNPYNGY